MCPSYRNRFACQLVHGLGLLLAVLGGPYPPPLLDVPGYTGSELRYSLAFVWFLI